MLTSAPTRFLPTAAGGEGPRPPRWRTGAFVPAGRAGSGSPEPRPRHPLDDRAAVLEGDGGGHGQARLTRERTGAGRGGRQGLQVVAGVRLHGVRNDWVVRGQTEVVEEFSGR